MTSCAERKVYVCGSGHLEAIPENCPMQHADLVDTRSVLADPSLGRMARESALVEAEGYMRWTRVVETMEFARRVGVRKPGLPFCLGLKDEAKLLSRVLRANRFELFSVACKVGSFPKEDLGIADDQKVRPGLHEPMCDPIGQARILNEAGTDLNVVIGLCVGHDTLFIKHSEAPVTCLVAKDRVLAHNPVGALNCGDSYYRKALYENHRVTPLTSE